MATETLRILADHLGLTLTLVATSEASGFPALLLESGNRHWLWQATSTAAQRLAYDAGIGKTAAPDTLVLPRADLLVAAGVTVDVQWSADGATNWTSVGAPFPKALASGDLMGPSGQDWAAEWTAVAKRAWSIYLTGATRAPVIGGGWYLGPRTLCPTDPVYGRVLGVARPHRGEDLEAGWPAMSEANAELLAAALGRVTPAWPAEGPVETVAGQVIGGRVHYLYHPTGLPFRRSASPAAWLAQVVCLTPDRALTESLAPNLERGPTTVRWRRMV